MVALDDLLQHTAVSRESLDFSIGRYVELCWNRATSEGRKE